MSNYKIVFSPVALMDVREAADWYNSQQKGLGKKFKEDIRKIIASILLNPFFASVKYENIRMASCNIFAFTVHYEVSEAENIVRIISVFHFSRRPHWLRDNE